MKSTTLFILTLLWLSEVASGQQFAWYSSGGFQSQPTIQATAVRGDLVAVGVRSAQVNGLTEAGLVHLFEKQGHTFVEAGVIVSPNPEAGEHFGTSVALSDDILAISTSPFSGPSKVYLFEKAADNTWHFDDHLLPSAAPGIFVERFGHSIAISGTNVIVTAPETTIGNRSHCGCAYLFANNGSWAQSRLLVADDADQGDRFGESVSINGDTIVIGAPFKSTSGTWSGQAYVYSLSNPQYLFHLTGPNAAAYDGFGTSVIADGEEVFVSAPYDIFGGAIDTGTVTQFIRSNDYWFTEQVISSPLQGDGELFGWSISAQPEVLAVLSPNSGVANNGAPGVAYIFKRQPDWPLDAMLLLESDNNDVYSGGTLSVNNDNLAIASPSIGLSTLQFFSRSIDCNNNEVADFIDISSYLSLDCNSNGIPDECDLPSFTILPLPASANISFADSVSGDGKLVAGVVFPGPDSMLWNESNQPVSLNASASWSKISGDGSSIFSFVNNEYKRWTNELGWESIGHPFGDGQNYTLTVSHSGQVAALSFDPNEPTPYVWRSNSGWATMTDGNGLFMRGAGAISSDDSVFFGMALDATNVRQLAYWSDILGPVSIGPGVGIFAISANADTAVGRNAIGRVVRWRAEGQLQELNFSNVPISISDDGATIFTRDCTVWDEENGQRNLASVLQGTYHLDLQGITLLQIKGVSSDGRTIVGYGRYNGLSRGWVARLGMPVIGDTNGDNDVDLSDLSRLLAHFGESGDCSRSIGDMNCDCQVDLSDLTLLLGQFGCCN